MESPERNDARRQTEIAMDNFWIGRFVRISNPLSDTYGQRGQVVAENGHNVTVRFADGSHQTRGMGTVTMDADQTTPVWPPPPIGAP